MTISWSGDKLVQVGLFFEDWPIIIISNNGITDWFATIFVMRGPSKILKKVYHSQTIHAASMCIATKLLSVLPHNLPDQTDEEFDAH